jgi:hypothetical protein
VGIINEEFNWNTLMHIELKKKIGRIFWIAEKKFYWIFFEIFFLVEPLLLREVFWWKKYFGVGGCDNSFLVLQ